MTKSEIQATILRIFNDEFEIVDPGLNDDLRDAYEFDSIDAIELLREIEILLDSQLTRDEKKAAMDVRTIHQIVEYVEGLALKRAANA